MLICIEQVLSEQNIGDSFETPLDSNKVTCATYPLILMTYFPKERQLGYNIAESILE